MRDLSVQRTRSQLRHELIDLLRSLRTNGDLPVIPPWLRSEIEGYFIRFRLDLPFGKAPTITICEAEDQYRKSEEARSEVLASLNDHDKLQDVVESVLGFLKRSPPYTREFVASKSSMRPELEIIFRWIESFWFGTLRRPPKLSVELQAFSDEIFKMCGVDVPGLSLVRRLQAMIRTAAAGSTA